MEKYMFRFAQEEDAALILQFIRELAEYEKMLDEVVATEELLKEWIFDKKKAEVIFALEDGVEIGFALFFHNFSTFLGRSGIYTEEKELETNKEIISTQKPTPEPTPTPTPAPTSESKEKLSSIRPEFKEAMNSYEVFLISIST